MSLEWTEILTMSNTNIGLISEKSDQKLWSPVSYLWPSRWKAFITINYHRYPPTKLYFGRVENMLVRGKNHIYTHTHTLLRLTARAHVVPPVPRITGKIPCKIPWLMTSPTLVVSKIPGLSLNSFTSFSWHAHGAQVFCHYPLVI